MSAVILVMLRHPFMTMLLVAFAAAAGDAAWVNLIVLPHDESALRLCQAQQVEKAAELSAAEADRSALRARIDEQNAAIVAQQQQASVRDSARQAAAIAALKKPAPTPVGHAAKEINTWLQGLQ